MGATITVNLHANTRVATFKNNVEAVASGDFAYIGQTDNGHEWSFTPRDDADRDLVTQVVDSMIDSGDALGYDWQEDAPMDLAEFEATMALWGMDRKKMDGYEDAMRQFAMARKESFRKYGVVVDYIDKTPTGTPLTPHVVIRLDR